MGYDLKYGKVTTEFGDIPSDEPVVVFRGRDKHLHELMALYYQLCASGGPTEMSPSHHLALINHTRSAIFHWQQDNEHRVKTPSSNRYVQRTGGHELE